MDFPTIFDSSLRKSYVAPPAPAAAIQQLCPAIAFDVQHPNPSADETITIPGPSGRTNALTCSVPDLDQEEYRELAVFFQTSEEYVECGKTFSLGIKISHPL